MLNLKKSSFILVLFLGLLLSAIPTVSEAEVIFVTGDVSGVWSADSVFVADSIYVSPGNTLEIEPGVHVLFLTANYFRVKSGATLLAVGTVTDTIKFLPASDGYNTLGIDFENASDQSLLEYCYFRRALYSAVSADSCDITIRNCLMEDNHGYYRAGGISVSGNSNALIEDNVIRNNFATGQGGGIYCNNSSPTIRGNIIEGNSVGPGAIGGGISCDNHSAPLIINNVFTNNSVSPSSGYPATFGQGGAIYCSNLSNPTIVGNEFYNNRVNAGGAVGQNGGGAIFLFAAAPVIENNVFVGNQANSGDGGALYLFVSPVRFVNNVFANNSAVNNGGAIYLDLSDPMIKNCIIHGNSAPNGPTIYLDRDSQPEVTYTDIDGSWEGDGNFDLDPLFRDPANMDYHLMATECGDPQDSPCIDAGDPGLLDSLLDCSWGLGELRSDIGAYAGADTAATGIVDNPGNQPDKIALLQNYPNPFNPTTTLSLDLPEESYVSLEVYNLVGQRVAELYQGKMAAGNNEITWDASAFPTGVYFARLYADGKTESIKMILLK